MMKIFSWIYVLIVFHFKTTIFFCHVYGASAKNCSTTDIQALLDFKTGLNDPEGRLSSWRGGDCCQWRGVGCENRTGTVIEVDLHNPYPVDIEGFVGKYGFLNLSGDISPSLLKLKSLRYLDLSYNTFEGIPIPDFFGSLPNLQYLNLSKAGFVGIIPSSLGNLSSLEYLDVSSDFLSLSVDSFQWMSGLSSLKHLEMNHVDLSLIESNWLEILNMLPYLSEIHLSSTGLPGSISSLSNVNFSSLSVIDLSINSFGLFPNWLVNVTGLEYVDLSSCSLSGRIPLGFSELPNLRYINFALNKNLSVASRAFFNGSWSRIEVIDLASNKVHGELPSNIGNMIFLAHFDVSSNNIEGGVPSTIGKLCNLAYLDLSGNEFSGRLPDSLESSQLCSFASSLPHLRILEMSHNQLEGKLPDWLGQLLSLEELGLSYNLFEGPILDSIGRLENLTRLVFAGNKLSGILPDSFGKLSDLTVLDVSSNQLRGIISENHFADLRNLKILQLSSNSLTWNVSSAWIPPFQVRNLGIGSCKIGPAFPAWLKPQKEIRFLDLSNASISDQVPEWFWDLSFNLSLLNFSHNQLKGEVPNPIIVYSYADLDLSFNFFEGAIPLSLNPIELFDLSNNRFRGKIPLNMSDIMPELIFLSLSGNQLTGNIPATIGEMLSLQVLDLSANNLSGIIPSEIGNCSILKALDFGNNFLHGEIPSSLGQLNQLKSLHLTDNKLSGEIPSSLQNLSNLETLDVQNNFISGTIPSWLANGFTRLRILNLRSNKFEGNISTLNITNLTSLQVLDLAENNFSGSIPASFGDLKAMAETPNMTEYLLYGKYRGSYYEEGIVINLLNRDQKYTKTLSLLTAIDISSNDFSGEFPLEITKLSGLRVLNMSGNKISGQIPQNISRLDKLLLLDLSRNKLSGAIPSSMASMSSLSFLNLSSNNLSGSIPYTGQMSTFENSSFVGNPNLCGEPLEKCQNDDSDRGNNHESGSNDDDFIDKWFYLSLGVGFAVAIFIHIIIFAIKRSWSDVYFDFIEDLAYRLLIVISRQPHSRHKNSG